MTDRELLQQALDAIEAALSDDQPYISRSKETVEALRSRLAQPEPEPMAFYVYKPTLPRGNLGNVADGDLPWIYDQDPSSGYSARMLVYTTPPQREWVGLTKEEIIRLRHLYDPTAHWSLDMFARAIEAKLKEKNT